MHYSPQLTQVLNEDPFYPFWVISQVVYNLSELLVLYWTCHSLHKKHIICFVTTGLELGKCLRPF